MKDVMITRSLTKAILVDDVCIHTSMAIDGTRSFAAWSGGQGERETYKKGEGHFPRGAARACSGVRLGS